mmetsp:Transcript_18579/g.37009  ORF Transcript_18579/g.37009 Transcript_18579/m.37009 type:complete len:95 (-) Transcript_18579:653-937(-)
MAVMSVRTVMRCIKENSSPILPFLKRSAPRFFRMKYGNTAITLMRIIKNFRSLQTSKKLIFHSMRFHPSQQEKDGRTDFLFNHISSLTLDTPDL